MLKKLTIQNYALIRHLQMEPHAGLNVITGETGAGKSIMLGALGLLMGNRADTKVLWDAEDKCVTEGEFNLAGYKLQELFKKEDLDYDDHTVIRREINASGKSRAFINDTPVTLDVLRKITSRLMDIHSQHETLELGTRTFQLQLIDAFAGNQKQREAYEAAWQNFCKAKEAHEQLGKEAEGLKQEADFIQFQLEELKKAQLEPQEQEKLESELKIQEHAEEIKSRLTQVSQLMGQSDYSLVASLAEIRSQLNAIADYAPAYSELLKRVESMRIELADIQREVENEEASVDFDAQRLEVVKERLSNLYHLQQKHRLSTVADLLALQENLQQKADKVINLDDQLAALQQAREAARKEVDKLASELSKTRTRIFNTLCARISGLLKELGIPDGQLAIEHHPTMPGPSGIDQVELLFSANKGIAPKPLAQVASGGEFARLMFSIKYVMAEKTAMPTLILDEIDTGVSGEVALQLGALMREMGQRHQIMAISHLPQVAAKGEAHYFVYKDNSQKKTVSLIRKLTEAERVEEVAKMIGGARPSAHALQNARELIGL
ncbi:MAG: DNA repair protein RecN [Bacteroidota bacterium]